jgi:hypothetical protein
MVVCSISRCSVSRHSSGNGITASIALESAHVALQFVQSSLLFSSFYCPLILFSFAFLFTFCCCAKFQTETEPSHAILSQVSAPFAYESYFLFFYLKNSDCFEADRGGEGCKVHFCLQITTFLFENTATLPNMLTQHLPFQELSHFSKREQFLICHLKKLSHLGLLRIVLLTSFSLCLWHGSLTSFTSPAFSTQLQLVGGTAPKPLLYH